MIDASGQSSEDAEEGIAPPRFPIQLEDVYCALVQAERRTATEDDPPRGEQGYSASLSYTELDSGLTRFRCRVELRLVARVLDEEVADLVVVVQGNYVSEDAVDSELHEQFVQYTPMVQLWPYARGYASDLGRLLGLNLPPLPLVDVTQPAHLPAPSDDAPGDERG